MTLGMKIAVLKIERHLTTEELSAKSGVPIGTLNKILNGETQSPTSRTIQRLALALGQTFEELYGSTDTADGMPFAHPAFLPMPRMKKVPLRGAIACGEPILAVEDIDTYVNMPEDVQADFALTCKGDSMIGAHIFDGDTVFIRQQNDVENGEIAAVMLGDEATLKRVYKIYLNNLLVMMELRAENPTIPNITISKEALSTVWIVGKAVSYLGKVR